MGFMNKLTKLLPGVRIAARVGDELKVPGASLVSHIVEELHTDGQPLAMRDTTAEHKADMVLAAAVEDHQENIEDLRDRYASLQRQLDQLTRLNQLNVKRQ